MKKFLPLLVFLAVHFVVFAQSWKTYPYTPTGSYISFPVDEGRHVSEPAEWWYTSGHLTGSTTGKHYSFMISYFYYPESIFDGFRIFNLSDDDLGLFYSEVLPLNYSILATDQLNIEAIIFTGGTETWRNKTDALDAPLPFEYELSATSVNGTLDLEYEALKPPLILADSGYIYQGDSHYTYYYSLTNNAITGTITLNGTTEDVTGKGWIDRQYGIFNPADGHEYEWFGIQLSNGMDINLYNIFASNHTVPNSINYRLFCAYIDDDTQITTSDFEIERLEYCYMPDTARCYSQKWRITCPELNLDVVVTTLHPYNEVSLPFRFYEGSATVTGTVDGISVTGMGFAELLHSYEEPDIQITSDGFIGEVTTLLTWQLNNPDDGNPLLYDLEYSTDYGQNFASIDREITDTSYTWNTEGLTDEPNIRVKVTGYSVDSTLSDFDIITLNPNAVNRIENQPLFNIYPNPSEGEFTVEGNTIRIIEIFNVSGSRIYSTGQIQAKHSLTLNIAQKGIFFMKVTTNKGSLTERLVIK